MRELSHRIEHIHFNGNGSFVNDVKVIPFNPMRIVKDKYEIVGSIYYNIYIYMHKLLKFHGSGL